MYNSLKAFELEVTAEHRHLSVEARDHIVLRYWQTLENDELHERLKSFLISFHSHVTPWAATPWKLSSLSFSSKMITNLWFIRPQPTQRGNLKAVIWLVLHQTLLVNGKRHTEDEWWIQGSITLKASRGLAWPQETLLHFDILIVYYLPVIGIGILTESLTQKPVNVDMSDKIGDSPD